MTTSFEPLTAKQQLVKLALCGIVMVPMSLIAAFGRHSLMGQHFGVVCYTTVLASLAISVSSRMWIQKIK
jgi:hypothetical protein